MQEKESAQQEELRLSLQRQLYRQSFWEFFKDACTVLEPSTDWSFNWHLRYIAERLQAETKRIGLKKKKKKDIIINVPFRSSKSLMISIIYPVWAWIQQPDLQFINLSYSESLALDHAAKCQILLETDWFVKHFPHIKLMKGFQSKGDFRLETGGARFSTGFLGSVLGKGADIIICDDPNKNSINTVEFDQSIKNYNETIYSRLNNPKTGLRIIIQQRLHTKDLTGYLLDNFRNDYEFICLPARMTDYVQPKELIPLYENGLLWGERFSDAQLEIYRRSLGSNQYEGQLMQRPINQGGSILKEEWFKSITLSEFNVMLERDGSNVQWNLIIDPAFTAKKDVNDPSAIMVVCSHKNVLYVRESIECWLEFGDLIRKIHEVADRYKAKKIFIEPKGSGQSVYQTLKEQTLLNVMILPAPKDSKITRVHAVSPVVEGGRVVLIDDQSLWLQNFVSQAITFPLSGHDDQVDCLVYAILNVLNRTTKLNYAFM